MSLEDSASKSTDFDTHVLSGGSHLHVRQSTRFKSIWIDVLMPQILRPVAATRLALLSRLLERGTQRLPNLQALNQYTDQLYGAALSAHATATGPFQILHLHFDAMDGAFAPGDGGNQLESGLALLGEVLTDPRVEDGGFSTTRVDQEKASLQRYADSLLNDRSWLAQRRCMELMCAGSPWAIAAHGNSAELSSFSGSDLYQSLDEFVATAPMDIYVCGNVDPTEVEDLCSRHLSLGNGATRQVHSPMPVLQPACAPRQIIEHSQVSQGRLVLGFRTPLRLGAADAEYANLVLLNLLFGGDAHSRLYSRIREERGLCYHIGSYLEPMAGLLLVEAGVEPQDHRAVVVGALAELQDLGTTGPSTAELERTRALAKQRLETAEDGRESLVRFHHARLLATTGTDRMALHSALSMVTPESIRSLAADIVLDTEYFLGPDPELPC